MKLNLLVKINSCLEYKICKGERSEPNNTFKLKGKLNASFWDLFENKSYWLILESLERVAELRAKYLYSDYFGERSQQEGSSVPYLTNLYTVCNDPNCILYSL